MTGTGTGTKTPYGEAIDPLRAAHCTIGQERGRTGAFIQGLYEQVLACRRKDPKKPVQIAELGCGPLAPIALSVASQFSPEEVQISLVDIHSEALEVLKELILSLELKDHVQYLKEGDLLTGNWSFLNPDIVVLEVMMPGLLHEPQAAVTAALAPQFSGQTLWLPHKIEIEGVLFHGYQTPASQHIRLGPIACVDDTYREKARNGMSIEQLIQVSRSFQLQSPLTASQNLRLKTRVEVSPRIHVPSPSILTRDVVDECLGRAEKGHSKIHICYEMGRATVDICSSDG